MADKFRTGDDALTGVVFFQAVMPNTVWFWAEVLDTLIDMTDPDNWQQVGTVTIDDAVQAAQTLVERFTTMNLGAIIAYVTTSPPDNTLACDGSVYLRTDYPNLYAALDAALIDDADHFHTPDLRGRTVIGAGTGTGLSSRSVGDSFGSERITLDISEIPSHSHTDGIASPAVITIGAGAPAPSAIPGVSLTGSAGSGASHDNMMPAYVLNYAMVAK